MFFDSEFPEVEPEDFGEGSLGSVARRAGGVETGGAMTVSVTVDDHRADIVLERPELLNAMNWELFEDLATVAGAVAERDDVRVVVVSGAGRSFSSGIDTTTFGFSEGSPSDLIARAQAGFRAIAGIRVPTLASVRGHAFGAGMQLALVCDLRVVTTDAQLGLLEANYGLVPDLGGTHRLPALAGPAVAKKMMWLGERIDGSEAVRRGIAELAVGPDDLDDVIDDLAARLASAPPLAVRAVKRLVDEAPRATFTDAMDSVAHSQVEIMASADFGEAISAFVERRKPDYRGC